MKPIAVFLALLGSTAAVVAQPRMSTQALSCAQVRALVTSRGQAVLSTGPTSYDRFVAGSGFCEHNETPELAWAPTADAAQCPIGYRCRALEQYRQD